MNRHLARTLLLLKLVTDNGNRAANGGFNIFLSIFRIFLMLIAIGAIAFMFILPYLLGGGHPYEKYNFLNQESETKTMLSVVNRTQQAYYTEHEQFASNLEDLELPPSYYSSKYYTFEILAGDYQGLAIARGINNPKNYTRDYIAGVNYNRETQTFSTVICQAINQSDDYTITNPSKAVINYGVVEEEDVECGKEVK